MDTLRFRDIAVNDDHAYARLMYVLGYPTSEDAAQCRIESIASDPDYPRLSPTWAAKRVDWPARVWGNL
ncbi:MAG: hypothetical protein ACRDIY_10020 [Chloroflexota bacterium]